MKEAVVLSLLFAILSTGFGDLDSSNSTNLTTTGELPTSRELTTVMTTEISSAGTSEHSSTHSVTTTSFANATTGPPKNKDVYAVNEDSVNGTYCILIKANISIAVNYINTTDNKSVVSGVVAVPAPDSAHVRVTGSCNHDRENTQWITISFYKGWNLTLTFERLNGKYFQSNISLDWDLATSGLKNAGNETGQITNNTHLFETSNGYLCMARKTLYLNSSAVNDVSGIYTEKLQLEAFQQKPDPTKFSDKYERCSEDSISNLVPIIVGACLGGLIIIVLIAYLIGRKRSRRGYESV